MSPKNRERSRKKAASNSVEGQFLVQLKADDALREKGELEQAAYLAKQFLDEPWLAERRRQIHRVVQSIDERLLDGLRDAGFKNPHEIGLLAPDDPRLATYNAIKRRYDEELESLFRSLKADTGQRTPRPAFQRDKLFLEWYEADGEPTYHSPAVIRDKWNGLAGNERSEIAPESSNTVSSADVVKKAIQHARRERENDG